MAATKPNIAALVEQMPDTDREIQAKAEEAKQQAQPDAPDKPKPKPDRWGAASKFTGPDPAVAEKIFAEILSGGRASITELLELVREPSDSDYKNYKARYVLHGLVVSAGRPGRENQRRLLADSLSSQLGGSKHSKAVKAVFIRELRAIGGKESVGALGKHLLDDELSSDATLALLAIREGAAPQFRSALEKSKGRNRVAIIQALGVLQDADSAVAFKKALGEQDRDVRRTAAWALANLGEASATDALLKFADSAEGWERTEATRHCLLLAERLAANGKQTQANRIYTHLHDTRKDPSERHIRETAEKALGVGRP
jgi:HEAT repeat protein